MRPTHSVYFMFIDGIGIGPAGPANPFSQVHLPGWTTLAGGGAWTRDEHEERDDPTRVFRAIDATLGVEGLPQSGTGQATIFSGVNCAKEAGRHWGPFPHSSSRPVLSERNLFHQVGAPNSAFANAYPERFFEVAAKRDRWPTTTRCCLDSGVTIRTLDHLRDGKAIAADLTGKGLARVAESVVDPVSEDEAARAVAALCRSHALVVSEYFHTDKAGHAQDMDAARACLESIDRFLTALPDHLDLGRTTFVLTSDHGNLEDLDVRTHTTHPVPLLAVGAGASHFRNVQDLTDLAPAIVAACQPPD